MSGLAPYVGGTPVGQRSLEGRELVRSGRELVALTERLYVRLVGVSLWAAVAALAFAVILAPVKVFEAHVTRTFAIALVLAVLCALAARRPLEVYLALRRHVGWLLAATLFIGLAMAADGGLRSSLYFPAHVVLALAAVTQSRRNAIAVGALLAGAMGAALLVNGYTPARLADVGQLDVTVAGQIGLVLWAWLLWGLVDRLARFLLNLGQIAASVKRASPRKVFVRAAPAASATRAPLPSAAPEQPVEATETPASPRDERIQRLNARQLEIASLLAEDFSTAEIAALLSVPSRTVYRLIEHSKRRAGVATREQLAALVIAAGVLPRSNDAG